MSERIKHRVNSILEEEFGVHESLIVDGATFYGFDDSLLADSLAAVEFVMALEEELGIDISDEAVAAWKTLGDVYALVEKLTPPIAKEPEVTGLDAVREKLEAMQVKLKFRDRRGPWIENLCRLNREALALLESEQGEQGECDTHGPYPEASCPFCGHLPSEQMRRDHEAMGRVRADVNGGACPSLVFDDWGNWTYSFAGTQPIAEKPDVITTFVLEEAVWATDPTDAILGTPTVNEEE